MGLAPGERLLSLSLRTGTGYNFNAADTNRCPIEIYMSSSLVWQAVVSIRRIIDRDGRRLNRPTQVPFGSPIKNRVDVELRIRQAQEALLNPNITDMDTFLNHPGESRPGELRFTRNSIVVEIRGPGVDDLAFVDLPGG